MATTFIPVGPLGTKDDEIPRWRDSKSDNVVAPGMAPFHGSLKGEPVHVAPLKMKNQKHKKHVPQNVLTFVLKHYHEAQQLAVSIGHGVTTEEVLAISADESLWWDAAAHRHDTEKQKEEDQSKAKYGNFFGLHGDGPAGTYKTKGNQTHTPKFFINENNDGYMDSGKVFVKTVLDKAKLTPTIGSQAKDFFYALHDANLYAVPNKRYGDDMVRNDPSTKGPYELVIEAVQQLKSEGKL
jgi:hypothetical protein